jgi:hypothetical protein
VGGFLLAPTPNGKPPPPDGAWCRGGKLRELHFTPAIFANRFSILRRHDALVFDQNQPSPRHVMCGTFADAFPAKSGAHDVPVIAVGLLSFFSNGNGLDESY